MLEQLREDATGISATIVYPEDKVRLIDVLLRPEVLVYEPLWTTPSQVIKLMHYSRIISIYQQDLIVTISRIITNIQSA